MIDRDARPYLAFWSPRRRVRHRMLADALERSGWAAVDAARLATDHLLIAEEMEIEGYNITFDSADAAPDHRRDVAIRL